MHFQLLSLSFDIHHRHYMRDEFRGSAGYKIILEHISGHSRLRFHNITNNLGLFTAEYSQPEYRGYW